MGDVMGDRTRRIRIRIRFRRLMCGHAGRKSQKRHQNATPHKRNSLVDLNTLILQAPELDRNGVSHSRRPRWVPDRSKSVRLSELTDLLLPPEWRAWKSNAETSFHEVAADVERKLVW